MKTVNQLLDEIDDLPLEEVTVRIGKIRQDLINLKKSKPHGGLQLVQNTPEILRVINQAKAAANI